MTNGQNGVAPSAIHVATAAQVAAVAQGFQAFVSPQHPLLADESADLPLQLVITEANRVIAGVLGRVFWQGLEIEVLWWTRLIVSEAWAGGCCNRRKTTPAPKVPGWPICAPRRRLPYMSAAATGTAAICRYLWEPGCTASIRSWAR